MKIYLPKWPPRYARARLWRAVLVQAVPKLSSYEPLQRTEDLATLLPGLFLLLNPGNQIEAIELSRSQSRGVALCGYMARIHFNSRDREAATGLGDQLVAEAGTEDGARLDDAVFAILRKFGPPSGLIAVSIAKVATGPPLPQTSQLSARVDHYWLQWHAAELLLSMNDHGKATKLNGARDAEPVLLAFISRFRSDIALASTTAQIDHVESTYEDGKIVRVLIDVVGQSRSEAVDAELRRLLELGDARLRGFPFLKEDIERALKASPDELGRPTSYR